MKSALISHLALLLGVVRILPIGLPATAHAESAIGRAALQSRALGMRFTYQSQDGERTMPCRHFLEEEQLSNWSVKCEDPSGKDYRKYRVHLVLSRYPRPHEHKTSYELLYWVTDITGPKPRFSSSTLWIHARGDSPLEGLEAAQSVEEDQAALRLEILSLPPG